MAVVTGAAFGGSRRNAFIYSAASVQGLGDIITGINTLCAPDRLTGAGDRGGPLCLRLESRDRPLVDGVLLAQFAAVDCLLRAALRARRWISVGGLALQPSEFAKIATICSLAHFLSRPSDELRAPHLLLRTLILIALPMGLILLEPDLGSSIVFIPVGLAIDRPGRHP